MAKEALFTVREGDKPLRLFRATKPGDVRNAVTAAIVIEKVTDPLTVAAVINEVNANGTGIETVAAVVAEPAATVTNDG